MGTRASLDRHQINFRPAISWGAGIYLARKICQLGTGNPNFKAGFAGYVVTQQLVWTGGGGTFLLTVRRIWVSSCSKRCGHAKVCNYCSPPLAVVSVMTSCAVGSGLPPDFKAPLSLELSSVTAVAPSLSRLWHSAILSTQADSKHTATVWVEKSASCVADSCVCTAERSYAEHFARPRPLRRPKHQLGILWPWHRL